MRLALVVLAFAALLLAPVVATDHCFPERTCEPGDVVCGVVVGPLNAVAGTADRVVCHA